MLFSQQAGEAAGNDSVSLCLLFFPLKSLFVVLKPTMWIYLLMFLVTGSSCGTSVAYGRGRKDVKVQTWQHYLGYRVIDGEVVTDNVQYRSEYEVVIRLLHWYTFIYKAILGGILPSSNSSWLRTESISDLMHGYVMYCRHSHPRGAKDAWLFMVHGLGMTSKRVLNLPHLSLCQGLKDSLRRNLRIPVIVFFLSRLFSFVKLCK